MKRYYVGSSMRIPKKYNIFRKPDMSHSLDEAVKKGCFIKVFCVVQKSTSDAILIISGKDPPILLKCVGTYHINI